MNSKNNTVDITSLIDIMATLREMAIDGIKTNISLHQQLVNDEVIQQGGMDIHYLEKN